MAKTTVIILILKMNLIYTEKIMIDEVESKWPVFLNYEEILLLSENTLDVLKLSRWALVEKEKGKNMC